MQGEIAMKLYISLCDYGLCVARKMRKKRAKDATRVEPDINSRVHFVGVNKFRELPLRFRGNAELGWRP